MMLLVLKRMSSSAIKPWRQEHLLSTNCGPKGAHMSIRTLIVTAAFAAAIAPAPALAWGSEGHVLVAAIARDRLTPATRAKVDAILAQDKDRSTPSDMLSRSYWADVWRDHGHRETALWHFADIELDHPDFDAACFGHPASAQPSSDGPAQACVVDRVQAFAAELGDPAMAPAERILALKYVLHFMGDMHQPLHMADNHDHGGNCVLVNLRAPRSASLHSYWDTIVVGELGKDAQAILNRLNGDITPERAAEWSQGDFVSWAKETNAVAVSVAYSFPTLPLCENDRSPVNLPKGYDDRAQAAAATQLERAGVRLAVVLEKALGPLSLAQISGS
jgi:hypothetical protein